MIGLWQATGGKGVGMICPRCQKYCNDSLDNCPHCRCHFSQTLKEYSPPSTGHVPSHYSDVTSKSRMSEMSDRNQLWVIFGVGLLFIIGVGVVVGLSGCGGGKTATPAAPSGLADALLEEAHQVEAEWEAAGNSGDYDTWVDKANELDRLGEQLVETGQAEPTGKPWQPGIPSYYIDY